MKIAAKGLIEDGYKAHGRVWPRSRQIVVNVSREEYAAIARDPHIVSVVVPEEEHPAPPPSSGVSSVYNKNPKGK